MADQPAVSPVKNWKTTIVGILGLITLLPQLPGVEQITAISPKAAAWVSAVGTFATSVMLIFKAYDKQQ